MQSYDDNTRTNASNTTKALDLISEHAETLFASFEKEYSNTKPHPGSSIINSSSIPEKINDDSQRQI